MLHNQKFKSGSWKTVAYHFFTPLTVCLATSSCGLTSKENKDSPKASSAAIKSWSTLQVFRESGGMLAACRTSDGNEYQPVAPYVRYTITKTQIVKKSREACGPAEVSVEVSLSSAQWKSISDSVNAFKPKKSAVRCPSEGGGISLTFTHSDGTTSRYFDEENLCDSNLETIATAQVNSFVAILNELFSSPNPVQ